MFDAWEIELHGHEVVYRVAGEGPPVVLIHGMVNASRHWEAVAEGLPPDPLPLCARHAHAPTPPSAPPPRRRPAPLPPPPRRGCPPPPGGGRLDIRGGANGRPLA